MQKGPFMVTDHSMSISKKRVRPNRTETICHEGLGKRKKLESNTVLVDGVYTIEDIIVVETPHARQTGVGPR
jgi:hypothetical protein